MQLERERLFTVAEVKRITGLSRTKIYQMMNSGELKSCRFGRSRRIKESDLAATIDRALELPVEDATSLTSTTAFRARW